MEEGHLPWIDFMVRGGNRPSTNRENQPLVTNELVETEVEK
jgi:hypothetical protein